MMANAFVLKRRQNSRLFFSFSFSPFVTMNKQKNMLKISDTTLFFSHRIWAYHYRRNISTLHCSITYIQIFYNQAVILVCCQGILRWSEAKNLVQGNHVSKCKFFKINLFSFAFFCCLSHFLSTFMTTMDSYEIQIFFLDRNGLVELFVSENSASVVSQLLYAFLSLCYVFPFSFRTISLYWYDHFTDNYQGKSRPLHKFS